MTEIQSVEEEISSPEQSTPRSRPRRLRPSPDPTPASGTPQSHLCPLGFHPVHWGKKHTKVNEGTDAEEAKIIGHVTYMVGVELAVSGQAVQEPLDVRPEEAVTSRVVDLVQMFSQSVPEVKGDFHHLVS